MNIIFRKYEKIIISIAVYASIILALSSVVYKSRTGINQIIGGEIMDRNDINEEAFSTGATDSFVTYSNRDKPILSYVSFDNNGNWQRIKAGTEVKLLDYFKGTDADGNTVANIVVKDITDSTGCSLMENYDEATDLITFSQSGIYTITCYMKDSENVEATRKTNFPVDN